MIKFVVKYTDSKGISHEVPVDSFQAALNEMTNSDAEHWTIIRATSLYPNFDIIKSVIDYVAENDLIKNITSILAINNETILVADCSHDEGNGIVILLKADTTVVNNLNFPTWKVADIRQPPSHH